MDKQSKFMRFVLRRLKNKEEIASQVTDDFKTWIQSITLQDLQTLALVKMIEGEKEHGPLKQVSQIEKEIIEERLDLLIWGLMKEYQARN